ncbi:RrF2 family transcriptional regulator [Rhodothermus bifroesti]|uniref:Rrf2 family transcriptional regulator n=2 Tax=Rhodothermus TaxID=29548 RepID=A0A7V2B2U8_RHOMR|nr:HTH-type transcriptional regulator CymR [bacterium HR18]
MFSRACEYGLRAVLYLATLNHNGYISIREIGEQLQISVPFLTKIFQKLTQAGLMQSLRGPSGGVMFARSPEEITLFDVIVAIDGPALFTECVLGLPGCGEAVPCPLHERWKDVRNPIRNLFATTTLADMARRIREANLRLIP